MQEDKEHVWTRIKISWYVGLWDTKKLGELSGGQKQAYFISCVIFAIDPDLFVTDEPTTGMDIDFTSRNLRIN